MVTAQRGEEAISSVLAPYLIAEMLGQAVDALGSLQDRAILDGRQRRATTPRCCANSSGRRVGHDRRHRPAGDRSGSGLLEQADYGDVTVVCADAEYPVEPGRRYNLIIVTVPLDRTFMTPGGVSKGGMRR